VTEGTNKFHSIEKKILYTLAGSSTGKMHKTTTEK